MIGYHISFENPMDQIPYTAKAMGLDTFQIFTRNARSMRQRDIYKPEIENFNSALLLNNMAIFSIHAPYSMNPASPEKSKRDTAVKIISEDKRLIEQFAGNPVYVLHPGSHMGDGSAEGLKRLSDVLHQVGKTTYPICVETMSGAGTELCYHVSEVLQLMDLCYDLNIGITFDTCHVFASGQDLMNTFWLLARYVQIIHVNDSKHMSGSYKDRHENLGKGFCPMETIKEICKMAPNDMPIILETPSDGYLNDIALLRKFVS